MEKTILNGFEAFSDFMPGANVKNNNTDIEIDDIQELASELMDDEDIDALKNNGKKNKEDDTDDTNQVGNGEEQEDEDLVVEEPKNKTRKPKKQDEPKEEEIIEDTEGEDDDTTPVVAFFDVLADELGIEEEDDKKPSTPEELVEYFKGMIEDRSKPQYASQEIEDLDNFVKNGGDIKEYFKIEKELDLDKIDLDGDEDTQKTVVREFLKEKGMSDAQIKKRIERYEDAGVLQDEAEDAVESLKEIRQEKKEQLLREQEKAAKEAEKRQQEYINSVVEEIKTMDNVRGIKIPEKDKRVLLDYIFKQGADGYTAFQKDWAKNVRHLLESAYFTMKGDALIKAAKSEGSSSAVNKFKDSLNRTGISRKTQKQDNTSSDTLWDSFTRSLRG